MNIAIACITAAALLPVACAGIAKGGAFGVRENHEPRAWLARQTGYRARAHAAQQNSWEAFPVFAAAVLAALWADASVQAVDGLALAFVVLRAAFIACYLTDRATLRSLVWVLGYAACLALFGLALGA